jgi:Tripartite tricarboxylate transporter family receptor
VKAKVPYDLFNGFVPVTELATAPETIVVNPSLPVKNMAELLALLKANPGKYSYASPGYGTSPHLACEWLFRLTYGLDVVHVPFQGAAPAVASTIAGETPILHIILPAVAPNIADGKLRALAVAARERSSMSRRSRNPAFRATRCNSGLALWFPLERPRRSSICWRVGSRPSLHSLMSKNVSGCLALIRRPALRRNLPLTSSQNPTSGAKS